MKTIKRILALVMVTLLVATLLATCRNKKGGETEEPAAGNYLEGTTQAQTLRNMMPSSTL